MQADRHIWRYWADCIQRWGATAVAATLLESLGAFSVAIAQLVYVCQPVVEWAIPEDRLIALANLLEDPAGKETFIAYLREAEVQ